MSVNKVFLVGNLGADPELRQTSGGQAVCNFTMATSFRTKEEEKTEWHSIVVWGNQAEGVSKYLGKGSKVHVEGRLQTRSYDDKEGVKRYKTEIVADRVTFLDKKGDGSSKGEDEIPF